MRVHAGQTARRLFIARKSQRVRLSSRVAQSSVPPSHKTRSSRLRLTKEPGERSESSVSRGVLRVQFESIKKNASVAPSPLLPRTSPSYLSRRSHPPFLVPVSMLRPLVVQPLPFFPSFASVETKSRQVSHPPFSPLPPSLASTSQRPERAQPRMNGWLRSSCIRS